MLRSLSSAVSGLQDQQTRMDVIGNNVANVNTTGFKAGRVTFKEGFAQLVSSATGPSDTTGGINPIQVGLGSEIGSIDTLYTQGNLDSTGQNTDMAVQGNALFIVNNGSESFYTRDGNFKLDANGTLVSANNGYAVQGKTAVDGKLTGVIGNLQVPIGQTAPATATTTVSVSGNLDASATAFDSGSSAAVDPLDPTQRALPQNAGSFKDLSITAYDSLGTKQDLKMVAWKTGANTWDWKFDSTGMAVAAPGITEVGGTHPITFNPDGSVDTSNGFVAPTVSFTPNSGANPVTISMNLGTGLSGLSQFAGDSNAVMRDQDGNTSGTLQTFTVDATGTIVGSFTNGTTQTLGQVALADFDNPSGLASAGDNMLMTTANSGGAIVGFSGEGSPSTIASGSLEQSNVDLAQEFTDMIVAQRGFQADGKVITTSDQMLQDLVQLKQ